MPSVFSMKRFHEEETRNLPFNKNNTHNILYRNYSYVDINSVLLQSKYEVPHNINYNNYDSFVREIVSWTVQF